MSYRHIDNLYKNQDILLFKECFAGEKIHGTSAHIMWVHSNVTLFIADRDQRLNFVPLFNIEELKLKFKELDRPKVVVYGEAYGGKCQGMSATYGKNLKFVAFEVLIEDIWLSVPDAESVVKSLNLDFVPYVKCSTDIDELDKQRDAVSVQAQKCGITEPKKREGVVLRPLLEVRKNNGSRIMAKHKADEFMETRTPRNVSEEDLKVLKEANAIAEEWVT